MGHGNAQTNRTLSGLAPDQSTARLSRTCTTTKKEPPPYAPLRGLDLIKSCAKFYENGVGVATPIVHPSHPLGATPNQRPITQVSPSRHSKSNIGTVAVAYLFLLLLSTVGVATIMWGGFVSESAKEPKLIICDTKVAGAQLPAPAITALLNLESAAPAQTPSNDEPDIIVHKVKTQPITGEALSSAPDIR